MSNSKLQSLLEIFNNKIFRIPDFQRGYSWGEQQLLDFWDDIQSLGTNKIHYTGLLTVEPIKTSDIINKEKWIDDAWLFQTGVSAYYIIDGQQRLTTVIILLNEILRSFNDDEGINYRKKSDWINVFLYRSYNDTYKSFVFGYEKDNPSDEFFKTKVLEQYSSTADKYPETLYTANLIFAKAFFADRLKDLDPKEKEEIFNKVVNRFKFNYYEIDDSLDVYVTFETMNNRGKKLSHLELLKNRLIYLTTLLHDDEGTKSRLRKDINETWKTIYEYLGKNRENPLDDDTFLFNHWIMYYAYDRSRSDVYADFLLKEKFTTKNVISNDVTFKVIKDYIDSLAKCVKQWFYIYNIQHSDYSDGIKEYVQKLKRVGMGAFPPMIMAVFAKESQEDNILQFLTACERFNFLVFAISRRSSNTQNSHLYRKAREYYTGIIDIKTITEEIRFLTDGQNENGEWCGWFDLDRFKSHIQELFFKNDKGGYYSWSGLRYFLYEYELELQGDAKTKVTWEDFSRRTKEDTIEHIYPQSAKNEEWKDFDRLKIAERRVCLNSLGNLLLLSQSKNSKLQNFGFEKKKRHTNKEGKDIGYYNGSHSEIDVCKHKKWTKKQIKERGLAMLEFMERRWEFRFEDWKIKKEDLLFPTK